MADVNLAKAKRNALHEIFERDGILDPQKVVEAARNPLSPLHSEITWNDAEAADSWRRDQARHLIVRYEVTYNGERVREWCFVPSKDAFMPFEKVAQNVSMKNELALMLQSELSAFIARNERTLKALESGAKVSKHLNAANLILQRDIEKKKPKITAQWAT